MSTLPPPSYELHPAEPPRASLIVLHGLGADGTDFLSLADEMKLDAIGPLRWVFPRAPVRPVTINGGHAMRAWYDIYGGGDARDPLGSREDETGIRGSVAAVHALLDREVARGVPAERIVLAGFSQGCAITLAAGLRYGQRLAGLVALSGYVPLAASTAAERHAANATTPVFGGHGSRDGIVRPERGRAGRDLLQSLGQPVEWHEYPMEHSVCIEEVRALEGWLLRVLA
jgi:phospholipase/carboxylesterase